MFSLVLPGISVAAAAVGVVLSLIGWHFATTPGWRDQRWFWLVTATAGLFSLCNAVVTLDVSAGVLLVAARGNWLWIGLHVAAWHLHAAAHLKLPLGRLERISIAACLVVSALAVVPGGILTSTIVHHRVDWLDAVYGEPVPTLTGEVAALVLGLAGLPPALRYMRAGRRDPDAQAHFLALVTLFLAGANDAFAATGRYALPYLLDLAFLATTSVIGAVLVRRFIGASQRLEALSTSLESMVAERTRELGEAQEALAKAERLAAVGRLAAGVAHEINNPAAAVLSNLTYLEDAIVRKQKVPPDASEALRDSRDSMKRIARIVRQLLDTGRVASASAGEAAVFDVGTVIELARRTVVAGVAAEIEVGVDVAYGLWATGDAMALEQVLSNLFTNAAHAIAGTGREGRILVRGRREGARIVVSVEDNGQGMDEDTARRAFEPFFTTKPFGMGTGLGLSVSLGLVRAMGGDLRVERTSDGGTAMRLELPATDQRPAVRGPTPVPRGGVRRKVLVVDDDRAVRASMRRMLAHVYDVDEAANLGDALAQVRSGGPYDAVLCDLMMDDGGGQAFYRAVAAERPELRRRVLFMTGGDAGVRTADEQAPAVLQKPLTVAAVVEAVEGVSS